MTEINHKLLAALSKKIKRPHKLISSSVKVKLDDSLYYPCMEAIVSKICDLLN